MKNLYRESYIYFFCWHPLLGERLKHSLNLFQLSSRYSVPKLWGF